MLRNVSDAQRSFFSVMQAKGTQPNPFTGADASGKAIDFYIDNLDHTPPNLMYRDAYGQLLPSRLIAGASIAVFVCRSELVVHRVQDLPDEDRLAIARYIGAGGVRASDARCLLPGVPRRHRVGLSCNRSARIGARAWRVSSARA